jgi:tRNA pseudouridine13 synthase
VASRALASNKVVSVKLRRLPEDFQVEELSRFTPEGGPFALYRLRKRSLTTFEALDRISTVLRLKRGELGYGGLKDKHALTSQFITLKGGPRKPPGTDWWAMEYLGQCSRPYQPSDIEANRFQLVLRDMSAAESERILAVLAEVRDSVLPNYFDDQRFGSVGESGEFIGARWCAGDYERALWLALADGSVHDRADEREQKRILRELWGQWVECKEQLARSPRRSIITFLVDHPTDFKRALALLHTPIRSLYLSAFQSALWNRTAARLIADAATSAGAACTPISSTWGEALFPGKLPAATNEALAARQLPLPSARNMNELGDATPLFTEEAARFGLELRQLRVKYPRDSFFSKGDRPLALRIPEIEALAEDDDLYAKRHKLTLKFVLPRGSYATIVVKRISACAPQEVMETEDEPEESVG